MPFVIEVDDYRVINALGISFSHIEAIREKLSEIEATQWMEDKVKELLESIELGRTALQTELASPNYALIKADVVSWAEGQKVTGMVMAIYQNKLELSRFFDLVADVTFESQMLTSLNMSGFDEMTVFLPLDRS